MIKHIEINAFGFEVTFNSDITTLIKFEELMLADRGEELQKAQVTLDLFGHIECLFPGGETLTISKEVFDGFI